MNPEGKLRMRLDRTRRLHPLLRPRQLGCLARHDRRSCLARIDERTIEVAGITVQNCQETKGLRELRVVEAESPLKHLERAFIKLLRLVKTRLGAVDVRQVLHDEPQVGV